MLPNQHSGFSISLWSLSRRAVYARKIKGRRWSVGTPHPAHQFVRGPRPLRTAITSRDAEWIGRTICGKKLLNIDNWPKTRWGRPTLALAALRRGFSLACRLNAVHRPLQLEAKSFPIQGFTDCTHAYIRLAQLGSFTENLWRIRHTCLESP